MKYDQVISVIKRYYKINKLDYQINYKKLEFLYDDKQHFCKLYYGKHDGSIKNNYFKVYQLSLNKFKIYVYYHDTLIDEVIMESKY